jgi:hypothetical protein
MPRPDDREVPTVERGEACLAEAFTRGHDGGVYDSDAEICVLVQQSVIRSQSAGSIGSAISSLERNDSAKARSAFTPIRSPREYETSVTTSAAVADRKEREGSPGGGFGEMMLDRLADDLGDGGALALCRSLTSTSSGRASRSSCA